MGISLRPGQHLVCDKAYLRRVGTHDAESNRPRRRRTKNKPSYPDTCLRCEACRNLLAKAKDKLISSLRIRRQDNHLGEVRIWQFGIVSEEETRRSAAYI